MEELLKAAMGQGLYAALFVALLFWVLRKNEQREQAMQKLLGRQSELLEEISHSLRSMDGRLAQLQNLSERGVVYYGEERDRCFQMAGGDPMEPGTSRRGGICHYPGSGRADAGSKR